MSASNRHRRRLTPKQEAFARHYVQTGNGCEAYRRAYDASAMTQGTLEVEASRLRNNPKVFLRIEELEAADAVAAGDLRPEKVLLQLVQTAELAREARQYSAAVRAIELQGKAIGMFRNQVDVSGGLTLTPNTAAMSLSVKELRALLGEPDDEDAAALSPWREGVSGGRSPGEE